MEFKTFTPHQLIKFVMGKGDIKTRRGKIANKSYGARRPRKIKKRTSVEEKTNTEKAK